MSNETVTSIPANVRSSLTSCRLELPDNSSSIQYSDKVSSPTAVNKLAICCEDRN